MKRLTLLKAVLFSSFALLLAASGLYAQSIPQLINYQGTLLKTDGTPVPDGQYAINFKIYSVATEGQPLWSEKWDTTTSPVVTTGGIFNVVLGTYSALLPSYFTDTPSTFLGITVGNDAEMVPRQRIVSVGYAFTAGNGVPKGGIIMWSGEINQIPVGWALCDGKDLDDDGQPDIPDLRDKFVLGAGGVLPPTGGSPTKNLSHSHATADHILTINEMPKHRHSIPTGGGTTSSGYAADVNAPGNTAYTNDAGIGQAHNHGNTGGGGNASQDIMPPYYALAYIIKL